MEKKTNNIQMLIAIMDGVWNSALNVMNSLSDDKLDEVIKRAEQCSSCPLNSSMWCSKGKTYEGVNGCGCYIPLKIKSFKKSNKCPLKRW